MGEGRDCIPRQNVSGAADSGEIEMEELGQFLSTSRVKLEGGLVKEHLALLGYKVRDVVTGFGGVVSSITFDLYGCVQGLVTPEKDKEGKLGEPFWFDVKRLEPLSKKPVMAVPSYQTVPGGQKLPSFTAMPSK
jgi:hypothetical protein